MALSRTLESLDSLVEGTDCALDDLLHALANDRRRRLLSVLAVGTGEQTLAGVAKQLATDERAHHGSRGEHYRQVYLDLYHAHVPELEDVGLVGYDSETGQLWLTTAGAELSTEFRSPTDRV